MKSADGHRRTILLVDDSPRIRPLVREILRNLNCRILEASTAEEAIKVAEAFGSSPDLLLTDITMPGMNGLELAAQLRRSYPRIRVLFMSGYSVSPVAPINAHFIEKPFRPDTLLKKVRELLKPEA